MPIFPGMKCVHDLKVDLPEKCFLSCDKGEIKKKKQGENSPLINETNSTFKYFTTEMTKF